MSLRPATFADIALTSKVNRGVVFGALTAAFQKPGDALQRPYSGKEHERCAAEYDPGDDAIPEPNISVVCA
jgi:hypothetical protein